MTELLEFLNKKPLFYKEIDTKRVFKCYEEIKKHFLKTKNIHIVGTNGKGSAGRFLANALIKKGFKTGHYSSPHILNFNERIYKNGKNVSYKELNFYHKKLLKILPKHYMDSLSYFEYSTFLAMLCFEDCDFVVLEAGLGGEFDATQVFNKEFSLLTKIGLDHEDILGKGLENIAKTKLRSIKSFAISVKQDNLVLDVGNNLNKKIYQSEDFLSIKDKNLLHNVLEKNSYASFLKENLFLSASALKVLNIKLESSFFEGFNLRGRFEKFKENIILDVGHNELAGKIIAKELKKMSFKVSLVYNTLENKNYEKALSHLKPFVKEVLLLDIEDERALSKEKLQRALRSFNVKKFEGINEKENYLVFGTFKVVESFLNKYGK